MDCQDINLRLHKHSNSNLRTIVQNDCQWKLHQVCHRLPFPLVYYTFYMWIIYMQIQDASNHLMSALHVLSSPPLRYDENQNKFDFRSAQEVIEVCIRFLH